MPAPNAYDNVPDVVVNSFTITCARQRLVEFSAPYMRATQRLLVPRGSGVREAEDLRGRRVCTSLGSTTEGVLRDLGFRVCRVRHHDSVARIEIGADELARAFEPDITATIDRELRALAPGRTFLVATHDPERLGPLGTARVSFA